MELIIIRIEKAGLAMVIALDDMIGITGKIHPFTSGHSNSFAMNKLR